MIAALNLKAQFSSLLEKLSLPFYKLVPSWTNNRIEARLLVPNRSSKPSLRIPRGITGTTIKTKDGQVQTYQIGSGPTVVLVHGWGGGGYQFFPLMRGLSQIGFSALSFDHMGHGSSDEKPATLNQLITTTNEVLTYVNKKLPGGVGAIVGHSTGCIAVANASQKLVLDMPLMMISPVFNFRYFFLKKLVRLNFPAEMIKHYANQFALSYKHEYNKMELGRKLNQYSDTTVIAHDQSDEISPIADSKKFCQNYPMTRLLTTKKYDHDRIINSEDLWHELKKHLNYEDTTIHFSDQFLND